MCRVKTNEIMFHYVLFSRIYLISTELSFFLSATHSLALKRARIISVKTHWSGISWSPIRCDEDTTVKHTQVLTGTHTYS